MIHYRFPEEKQIATYYANRLGDDVVEQILVKDNVENDAEALHLSRFFWRMVDLSVADDESGVEFSWPEGREFWNEKIMRSISGHLEQAGFEAIWEMVADQQ